MPTSCIPPSSFPSHSIRQLKERVTNLRMKHDQIYNLPLQPIEPQVNWSTVIDEKQVPREPSVHQLGTGRTLSISPWRNRLLETFLAAGSCKQHGKVERRWVAGKGADMAGQDQLPLLAAAGLSKEKLWRIRAAVGECTSLAFGG